ncbi:MAG: hypothetical protein SGBAC_007729 [Bacillariaceae sp.]
MDVLKARDSLNHSEHDPLFFTSDEFMVELLKSPVKKEALEHSLYTNTNKALGIINAPPSPAETHEFKQKITQLNQLQTAQRKSITTLRDHMEKAGSFSSKLSDGLLVKINPPSKGKHGRGKAENSCTGSTGFRKSPRSASGVWPRSRSVNMASFMGSPSSKIQSIDISARSDQGPVAPTLDDSIGSSPGSLSEQSKICFVSSNSNSSSSEWSEDISQSSALQPKPNVPLQRMMSSVSEDEADGSVIPTPPPSMTSMSPYNNALNKKSLRKSASARLGGSQADSLSLSPSISNSRRTKRLSFQVNDSLSSAPSPNTARRPKYSKGSPKVERQSSKWLMASPSPSPLTPRSKKFYKSSARKSRILTSGMPMIPLTDYDEDEDEDEEQATKSPVAPRQQPPQLRPLDKILMRDYPSTTTATTFLSADTDAIDYSMSSMFPRTKETERIILKRVPNKRDIFIENSDGEKIGMIDFSMVNQGKRLIKDACGQTCALIFLNSDKLGGNNIFKICGNKPATRRQRLSNETGYYTWAEVKNTGSFGGKFVMNRFSPETSACTAEPHLTKAFGSLFSRGKSKGYVFCDSEKKECVKMVSLKKGKGVIVGPNRDLCLMLAYAVCVDEMVEYRLR